MKYKTLFRLMLKAVGVFAFLTGLMSVIGAAGGVIGAVFWPMGSVSFSLQSVSWFASGLFGVAFGLYLFFGGRWVADKAIPGNRPYCHECGYDLSGACDSRCPECDTPFRPADVAPPRSAGMPVPNTPGGSAPEE